MKIIAYPARVTQTSRPKILLAPITSPSSAQRAFAVVLRGRSPYHGRRYDVYLTMMEIDRVTEIAASWEPDQASIPIPT